MYLYDFEIKCVQQYGSSDFSAVRGFRAEI